MAKEQGVHKPLTNCPPCTSFLEQGLELMREPGEPMECGIFDFCKVFSRAFGEEEDGAGESSNGRWVMLPRPFHVAKEQGVNKLLTNCPPCTSFLEQGLELMRESGEPMECGIFDFYKVFSRAFGGEGNGAAGS